MASAITQFFQKKKSSVKYSEKSSCIEEESLDVNWGDTESPDVDWRDTKTAGQCLSHLCLSEYLSDISFTFGNDSDLQLHAHKFVLSMRSSVFEAMFYGPLAEVGDTVLIKDISSDTMKVLLRFMYTDKPALDGNNVLPSLYAAKKYALEGLVKLCRAYLEKIISSENVCIIHEQAVFYDIKPLEKKCFDYILENASNVLGTQGFLKLSHATLHKLLKHEHLAADEVNVFKAAINWAESFCRLNDLPKNVEILRDTLGKALFAIRFPIMPIADFAKVVTPVGILTSEEQIMLYQYNATGGATAVWNFPTHERSGKTTTIDVSKSDGRGINWGPSLGGFHLHVEDIGRGDQLNTLKNIRLKSVSGAFVKRVKSVTNQDDRSVAYQIKGNNLCFNNPLKIIRGWQLMVSFHTDKPGNMYNQRLYSDDQSYNSNLQRHVHGRPLRISQLPEGIEAITFIH